MQGSYRGGPRGNGVPIVKVFITHYARRIANHFPTKTALGCRILHIQSQNISEVIHPDLRSGRERPHPALTPGAWTQTPFPLCSLAIPLFLFFYETTTDTPLYIAYMFVYKRVLNFERRKYLTK